MSTWCQLGVRFVAAPPRVALALVPCGLLILSSRTTEDGALLSRGCRREHDRARAWMRDAHNVGGGMERDIWSPFFAAGLAVGTFPTFTARSFTPRRALQLPGHRFREIARQETLCWRHPRRQSWR
jgi:hypothetical protein